MSNKEKYTVGFNLLTENSSLQDAQFSLLCSCVVLYQASMEAVMSNAIGYSAVIRKAVRGEGFYKDWKRALRAVDEPIKEIQAYNDDFYTNLRNNLVHFYPQTEDRLKEVNEISPKRVYSGVRYGWWAHSRLWEGTGRVDTSAEESWGIICRSEGLNPELFPETHPTEVPTVT